VRAGPVFLLIAVVVTAARLCHSGVLWADDNLPLAAAMQVAHGKVLYRDVWFDKPALVSWIYLLWGARAGVVLRLAGAAYVMAVSAMAWQFARSKWGEREGLLAACFGAFFLTFGLPSAVIPLASDMLLVLPHLAAVYLAWRGRAFWSGVAAGVGMLASSKAVFVLAVCALMLWHELPALALGFIAPNALAVGWMAMHGAAREYYRQAWEWGRIYSAHTFVENPLKEGLLRTVNWIGFQAALVVGAILAIRREWKLAVWLLLAFAGVVLGLRFFPRYYFLLLPPTIVAASRGWALVSNHRLAMVLLCALLAVPAVRFGKSYITLARGGTMTDLAIDCDSRAASDKLRTMARSGDTLFVWGFRPDIFIDSELPAGTRFLESQPISGVLADRHLFSTESIAPEFTAPNVRELAGSKPSWVVDGLGLYNPPLALARQKELAGWFGQYEEAARTDRSIIYKLKP
jgi:MFS family permease